jgi:hypothetical protein
MERTERLMEIKDAQISAYKGWDGGRLRTPKPAGHGPSGYPKRPLPLRRRPDWTAPYSRLYLTKAGVWDILKKRLKLEKGRHAQIA